MGYSQNFLFLPVTPFFSLGLLASRIELTGDYWGTDYEWTNSPQYDFKTSVTKKRVTDFSLPVKFGFLIRHSPNLQPFFTCYTARVLMVPNETESPARYTLDDTGLSAGLRIGMIPGWLVLLENQLSVQDGAFNATARNWKAKFSAIRQY